MTSSKNRRSRWAFAPAALAVTTMFLAGCSTSSSDDKGDSAPAKDLTSSKSTVIFAISGDPTCLDPQQTSLTTALNIGRQVVDSLVDQDPKTGEIVPWLATSFEASDDLTSYTFKLRDDVTFSDGTGLTAQVVKDNFDSLSALAAGGKTASLAGQYLANYASTDIVDDSTVTVTFSAPNAPFLQGASTMSLGILADASTTADAAARCTTGVIGSGPFVYDSYEPNDSVVITARKGYDWGSSLREHTGDALVKRIEFPVVTEASVRTGGLESGDFDIIQEVPYVDEARFTGDDFHLYSKANTGVATSLIPNTTRPIVGDEAVRKAMLLGTDRTEINQVAGYQNGDPVDSVLTSSTLDYASQAKALKYDPDAAEKLLDKAGWKLGSDGIREKDGQKLSVKVTAFYSQDALETVQMELKKIGIDLQINMTDTAGFFGAIAAGDYDFLAAGLTRTDPDALRTLMLSTAKSRWAIIDDPDLDAVLTEQASTADTADRAGLIEDAQKLIVDKAYLIPLLQSVQLHASSASVEGLVFDSASRINLYDVRVTE
jgi:peptide/nickel transport system substrate-binding protein